MSTDTLPFDRILALCRPGFEGDAAAELSARAAASDTWGHARTRADAGLLEFFPGDDPLALLQEPAFASVVFPRQFCAAGEACEDLPPGDRISPLLEGFDIAVCDAVVETADGDAHRPLGRLTKQLAGSPPGALKQRGLLVDRTRAAAPSRFRYGHAGVARTVTANALERGARRRRAPAPGQGAPSRSAARSQEALLRFLTEHEIHMQLGDRATAVDLGAAPGGWTWVLRQQGARVTAVDNGPLAPALASDPYVEHLRADAFTYQPRKRVDWLVCDVVDKPARVVELMARWLRREWARRAIFNLKLPMKRRWAAVEDAEVRFRRTLGGAADDWDLQIRQLCHDREEVTCSRASAQRGTLKRGRACVFRLC